MQKLANYGRTSSSSPLCCSLELLLCSHLCQFFLSSLSLSTPSHVLKTTSVLLFPCTRALACFYISYQVQSKIFISPAFKAFHDFSTLNSHSTPPNQCSSQTELFKYSFICLQSSTLSLLVGFLLVIACLFVSMCSISNHSSSQLKDHLVYYYLT